MGKVIHSKFGICDKKVMRTKAKEVMDLVAQQPDLIGATPVENAKLLIDGKEIPSAIAVEVTLITKDAG